MKNRTNKEMCEKDEECLPVGKGSCVNDSMKGISNPWIICLNWRKRCWTVPVNEMKGRGIKRKREIVGRTQLKGQINARILL